MVQGAWLFGGNPCAERIASRLPESGVMSVADGVSGADGESNQDRQCGRRVPPEAMAQYEKSEAPLWG
jgi:hypothetical protein